MLLRFHCTNVYAYKLMKLCSYFNSLSTHKLFWSTTPLICKTSTSRGLFSGMQDSYTSEHLLNILVKTRVLGFASDLGGN